MEAILKSIVFLHIMAGTLTLVAAPIALFANQRYVKTHKMAGKVFFYAMIFVCISGIIGFIKRPDQVFYQFLLGISILVLAGILRGVRALQIMKNGEIKQLDWLYTIGLGMSALWMLGMSVWNYTQYLQTNNQFLLAFVILFGVFGVGSLNDVKTNYSMFSKPFNFEKTEWLKLHVQTMIGCFTASTTAFTVNTAHFLPWYIQWFGPTLILLPLQIYWGRKLKKQMTIA